MYDHPGKLTTVGSPTRLNRVTPKLNVTGLLITTTCKKITHIIGKYKEETPSQF